MKNLGGVFDPKLCAELAPQVLGSLMRRFGDFVACEDAVQEALISASIEWPLNGMPANPRGWLGRVAHRRMIDHIRSESARRRRESEWFEAQENSGVDVINQKPQQKDTLHLFFMCCHASLSNASAIALTLRAVGGLTTAQIARAFFVPESTMAQRISRAKQSIQNSAISFDATITDHKARLPQVLHILYLIFNEGYSRGHLATDAIRLSRLLVTSLPGNAEAEGLLALMLLTDARREARQSSNGSFIPLDEQDRRVWNDTQIQEGVSILTRALQRGAVGPYQLQAAIAAVHDEAKNAEATDWPQILALYDLLFRMHENPVVRLNRAVALAMVHGPKAGLESLTALDTDTLLENHYRLHAVRAYLYEKLGDKIRALAEYQSAAAKTTSLPERDYLVLKASRLRHHKED